jgi:hypothetical protein
MRLSRSLRLTLTLAIRLVSLANAEEMKLKAVVLEKVDLGYVRRVTADRV